MLNIRLDQVAAMLRIRNEASVQSFMEHFRNTIPERIATLNDETLHTLVSQAMEKAGTYGIIQGGSLLRFLTLSLVFGMHFDDQPAAKRFLTMTGIDVEAKMELLTDLIIEKFRNF